MGKGRKKWYWPKGLLYDVALPVKWARRRRNKPDPLADVLARIDDAIDAMPQRCLDAAAACRGESELAPDSLEAQHLAACAAGY